MELVGIYCRVSNTDQADSLPRQLATIQSYCAEHEYTYDEYIDSGISGTGFTQRVQFLKMLKLEGIDWIKEYECFSINKTVTPKYNKIICKSSSRFGRTLDCIKVLQLLNRQGVQVVFIEDGTEVTNMLDPSTQLVTSINAVVNANFSIQNSQRVKNGMTAGAKAGNVLTSNSIYGYDYNPYTKELTIIPEQAEIIRWIFTEYIGGKGFKVIADTLNKQGYTTKKGKPFNSQLIGYIIQNEKYCGQNVRMKYSKSKLQGDKRAKKNSKDNWIITENIPAIITKDTFNKANQIRENKKSTTRGKYKGTSILAGKIHCGECGYNYVINVDRGKQYYVCYGKKFKSTKYCHNKNLYVHTIQELINSNYINALVFKNKKLRLNRITSVISDLQEKQEHQSQEQIKAIKMRVLQAQNNKSKLLDLLINNSINQQDYEFKNNLIDQELAQLQIQLEELEGGAEDKIYKLKKLKDKIAKIPINKKYTWEQIVQMIQSITVYQRTLKLQIVVNGITFNDTLEY